VGVAEERVDRLVLARLLRCGRRVERDEVDRQSGDHDHLQVRPDFATDDQSVLNDGGYVGPTNLRRSELVT
jgi:hypothetical protein